MRYHVRALAILAGAALVVSCSETNTAPTPPFAVNYSAVKFWEAGASASWNDLATSLATRRVIVPQRLHAYLSIAQFRAAQAAEAIRPHPPTSAAIGAASAAVLNAFFPLDAAEIAAALDAQEAAASWPGAKYEDFAAGEALGSAVGAKVLALAAGDNVGVADPGLPPVGPGFWLANGAPARSNYRARRFYLASDSEFRPDPPPAFGSPAFLAAVGEVRQISDTRTPEQIGIANYWNVNQSGRANTALQTLTAQLIRAHHVQDAAAAKILFLVNTAYYDALIGCWDAKYHYWYIRPPQADPLITTVFAMPNHPSYPSGHSCVTGAITTVLAAAFPSEARRLADIAVEASLSRLYAGIHYRFDMQAGLALGRAVATKALATDPNTVAVLP